MTGFVRIFQIQSIIPNLIDSISLIFFFSDFKFENKNYSSDKNYNINTLPHARNSIFKIN